MCVASRPLRAVYSDLLETGRFACERALKPESVRSPGRCKGNLVRASTPCKVGRRRSELSAFCPPPRGVCDLIKASDTPDGPRPRVSHVLRATAGRVRTRRYWQRRCSTASNHTVDLLDEGGRTRRGVEALLSPLADNGSADQCAPRVST
jgi:hypothetical protein